MLLQAPAGLDDFNSDEEQLRLKFQALWNRKDGKYLGRYVAAAAKLPNYVDQRDEAPTSDPTQVPWNGFPKLMSRWFGDETSDVAREQAEAAADTLATSLYWIQPASKDSDSPSLHSCLRHQLPFFADHYGPHVLQLARPRRVLLPDGSIGPELIEQYRQQDEYLEWHAERDDAGNLISLTFTAEPPDYWLALAEVAPKKVLELYQKLISPLVTEEDLFYQGDVVVLGIDRDGKTAWYRTRDKKGGYNPLNIWTTSSGIMHLTHPANTLGAEVNLAKEASEVRDCDALPSPTPAEPSAELRRIACGGYGGINRSSDPLIGLGVGDVVGAGMKLSLTDPVGLYIAKCDLGSLRGPQGEVISNAASIIRGHDDPTEPRIVRLRVEAPAGSVFKLGDCMLANRRLHRGGQIARLTTMALYVQTYDTAANQKSAPCESIACRNSVHKNFFTAGDRKGCPTGTDPIWLLDTPYVETTDFELPVVEKAFNVLKSVGDTPFFKAIVNLEITEEVELNLVTETPPVEAPVSSRNPLKF